MSTIAANSVVVNCKAREKVDTSFCNVCDEGKKASGTKDTPLGKT